MKEKRSRRDVKLSFASHRTDMIGDNRINEREFKKLEETYQGIGDFFKKTGGGYSGYIFTGNLELIKKVGLRTKRRIILYNGEIECRLLEYELYAGSLKHGTVDKQTSGEI